ncbi:MAG: MarR family transcriptional regulator [Bacteroidales bacterium]|nr:MarR family transcriptional regulator [Bacteroidales bacterium]
MDHTHILIKIRKIVRSINLESKKIQKEHGISIPQVLCLNYLHRCNNFQSTQNQIREYLNLNSSTVTGIINRLEKKGLIARLPKFGDKRVTNISLTSAGDHLLEALPPLLHERLSNKLNNYAHEQISEIDHALDLLISLFEIEGIDASPVITDDMIEGEL